MKRLLMSIALLSGIQLSPAEIEGEIHAGYTSGPICSFSSQNLKDIEPTVESFGTPILVTVCDEHRKPVTGAYAALKRLAPDDYKESDLMKPDTARTDSKGIAVVMHPRLGHGRHVNPKLVDVMASPPVPPVPVAEITLQIPEGLSEKSDISIPKKAPASPPIQAVPEGEPLRGCITVIAEGYETKAVQLGEACGENGIEIGEHTTLRYTIVLTRKDAGKAPDASERK
jgi:hypothetical protein